MNTGDELANAGLAQILEWARAWVENETVIPETPHDKLSDKEKAGLALLSAAEKNPAFR
jgi:hypothetical protein